MPADSSTSSPDQGGFLPKHYRTVLFYGEEAFARIAAARITVIGLGGVGGHAALALARSGIGELHLVDFDRITASSLNRSAFAGPMDVGRLKTAVLAEYLAKYCPETVVTITEAFCNQDTLAQVVPSAPPARPDLVIDAIDALNPKVGLLVWCHEHDIPVLTSLGAAGKRDIGLVRTGDISESRVCPLARQVRLRLKRRGVASGIPAIWSIEPALAHRPQVAKEIGPGAEPGSGRGAGNRTHAESGDVASGINRGRERHTLASQMTLPGVFGYGLAAMALDLVATAGDPPTEGKNPAGGAAPPEAPPCSSS